MLIFSLEDIKKAFEAGFNRGIFVTTTSQNRLVGYSPSLPEFLEKEYGTFPNQKNKIKEKDEINVV